MRRPVAVRVVGPVQWIVIPALVTVAVTADAVHEVTILQTKDIEHVPASVTAWPADYVQGLYKGPNGFVLLPDLSTIFAAQCAKMAAA